MNLEIIAGGAIAAVNPQRTILWMKSNGYTTDNTGHRAPSFAPAIQILAQIQPLTSREQLDLRQNLDSLNIQGTLRAIYLAAEAASVVRIGKEGGDLFQFSDPVLRNCALATWLAVSVEETWSTWSKVIVQLQNGM
jgi:hypothetical protein